MMFRRSHLIELYSIRVPQNFRVVHILIGNVSKVLLRVCVFFSQLLKNRDLCNLNVTSSHFPKSSQNDVNF